MAEEQNKTSKLAYYYETSFRKDYEARVSIYEAHANKDGKALYNAFVYFKCKHFEETKLLAGFTNLAKAAMCSGYQIREFQVEKERCDERYKYAEPEEKETNKCAEEK
jgi:hypothetical protein